MGPTTGAQCHLLAPIDPSLQQDRTQFSIYSFILSGRDDLLGLRCAELLQMAVQFLHLLRIPRLGLDISFYRQGLGVQMHTEKYKSSTGSAGSVCKTKVCLAE